MSSGSKAAGCQVSKQIIRLCYRGHSNKPGGEIHDEQKTPLRRLPAENELVPPGFFCHNMRIFAQPENFFQGVRTFSLFLQQELVRVDRSTVMTFLF